MEIKEHIDYARGCVDGATRVAGEGDAATRASIAQAHALIAIAKLLYERMGAVR